MGAHAEFLRVALEGNEALSRTALQEPHSLARWPDARVRELARIALTVSLEPWSLERGDVLSDEDFIHAVGLAAYFGHLNRVADATGVPLDYQVVLPPVHAEPATPPLARAPRPIDVSSSRLRIESRENTFAALTAWRDYILARDGASDVETWVNGLVGAGHPVVASGIRHRLVETATLAPWRLNDAAYAELRAEGFDDASLFRVISTATTFGAIARIRVALASAARA